LELFGYIIITFYKKVNSKKRAIKSMVKKVINRQTK